MADIITTVALHPGASFSSLGVPGPPNVVGAGVVWNDANDSSYVEVDVLGSPGKYLSDTTLDTLELPDDATVTSVTVNLRASAVLGMPCRLNVLIHNRDATTEGSMGPVIAPCDGGPGGFSSANEGWYLTGGPTSLTHTFDDDDFDYWGVDFESLVSLLAVGANIGARVLSNFPSSAHISARVFELSVDVTYTTPPPPEPTGVADLETRRLFARSRRS